jgi:hypothetical protein
MALVIIAIVVLLGVAWWELKDLLTPRAKAQNRVVRGALAILLVIFLMWKISSESSEATTQNASGSWRAQVLIQLPGPIQPEL